VINLKTAKALVPGVPPMLLADVDDEYIMLIYHFTGIGLDPVERQRQPRSGFPSVGTMRDLPRESLWGSRSLCQGAGREYCPG
jgi:hypothetical protein